MTGTLALVRLALRRDRLRLTIWIASIVLLTFVSAVSVQDIYSDPRELAAYARTVESNAAIVAMTGPVYAIDTYGGRIAYELSSQLAIAIGLMALLSMTRHTRAEEESGRAELLRAAPTGRFAGLAAALVVTCGASVVVGLGVAVSLVLSDLPVTGSFVLGGTVAMVGVAFAAVGAVAVQVTEHGRAASGISLAVLGVAFVLRAVGDTGTTALRWLSPIGIAQAARGFAGDRWWPLLLLLVVSAVLVGVAVRLAAARDLGAGLVATRPGPPAAAPALGRPFGLALRLQRGVIAAWSIGLFLLGATLGSIAEGADDLIGDNPDLRDVIAAAGITDLSDAFLATMTLTAALVACGFVLQSAMRPRTEETAGRGELVLSTGVPRETWLLANVGVTALGTTVALAAAGLGTGLAHAVQTADAVQVPRLLAAALGQAPAVLLLGAIAVLLFGVAPRFLQAAWAPLALAAVVGILGDLLSVPSWLAALSPFDHLAQAPAEPVALLPVVLLLVLAAACVAGGIGAYRHRDAA